MPEYGEAYNALSIEATSVDIDVTPPGLTTIELDLTLETVILSYNEDVVVSKTNIDKFSLAGIVNGTNTIQLNGNVTHGASNNILMLALNANTIAAIKHRLILCKNHPTVYMHR